jgi:hypothetical protein
MGLPGRPVDVRRRERIMGWDADALRDGHYLMEGTDPDLFAVFEAAAREVQRLAVFVDQRLFRGGLDCKSTRIYLEEAIGREVEGIFSPEEVRHFATHARWRDPTTLGPNDLAYYWSARKFLETCAAHGLGVEMY